MHKTFISYHHKNEQDLKDELISKYGSEDFIDSSVGDNEIDSSLPSDAIMRIIREKYLHDSTVTLVLVGYETSQRPYVNSEIQASLRDTTQNTHNGLLAVIRDELYDEILTPGQCPGCACGVRDRNEGKFNQYLPNLVIKNHRFIGSQCHYSDDDVYCSLIQYSDFKIDPEKYINDAFKKRNNSTISIYKTADPGTPLIGG